MKTAELDYLLPPERIAREPCAQRDAARLLVLERAHPSPLAHRTVRDLPELLEPGSLLVVNDTRVIPARLVGRKASGGRVEIFLLRAIDPASTRWHAFGRASKTLRIASEVEIASNLRVRIDARRDDGSLEVTLLADNPFASVLEHGQVPLPPYIGRSAREADRERYQTVYAKHYGAVAAPTAGLHLSENVIERMKQRGVDVVAVTLHVGAGTFVPVTADDLDQHAMHSETYSIEPSVADTLREAKARGRPVVAVGTTVVRTLESWGLDGPLAGETTLLIQPGYRFRIVDQLLTNFHLPRSTLLALVMAFAGIEPVRAAYAHAIETQYRFYSYGDAMFVR